MSVITSKQIKSYIPEERLKCFIESAGLLVNGTIGYSVSHPDDTSALITLTIPVEEACCQHCEQWRTNELIMEKYGEGMGRCEAFQEPKACSHVTCLGFSPRKNQGDK